MNKTIFSKRNVIATSVVATIAIFLSASLAFAHGNKGKSGRDWDPSNMAEQMTKRLTNKLDLSTEQQQRVKEIILEGQGNVSKRREDTQARITEAFTADTLSPQQAAELLSIREQTRDEMRGSFAETLSKVHSVLTPEQREEAVTLFTNSRMSFLSPGESFDRGRSGKSRKGRDRDHRGNKGRNHH